MRRVVSYGGASGVPASQRLKLKISMTVGMHLLANDVKQEQQGFLAPVVEPHHERIIHRTSGVTRNLTSIESFKGFASLRRDSFTAAESSTLENAEECAQQGTDIESRQRVRVKARDDQDLVGNPAGILLVVDRFGQKDHPGANSAVNRNDHRGSHFDVGKGASLTTNAPDSTITPAHVKAADGGEACHPGSSRPNEINSDNDFKEQVLGSDETHAQVPSASIPNELLQEGCQLESSFVSGDTDRNHIHDLGNETRVCELSRTCTSSIVPGVVEDRGALCRDYGEHLCDQDKVKDSDERKAVGEPSNPSGNSGRSVIQEDLLLERNNREAGAALCIQSCWKGWLRRRQYKLLKEEVAATAHKHTELNSAATVVQNCWRVAQSRRVLKHLKTERTVKNRAATVIQAHARGHLSRRELQRISYAALTIQNCWRRYCSWRQGLAAAAALQEAEEIRRRSAVTLQAHVRGFIARQKFVRMQKAAVTIKRQWKAYSGLCTQAATKLQACVRAFLVRRKYAVYKEMILEERAAVLIQAYVRGHLVRCHLTMLHTAALIIQLQWRRYSRKCQFQEASSEQLAVHGADPVENAIDDDHADLLPQSGREFVWVEKEVQMECFDELDLLSGDDELIVRSEDDSVELCPEVSPVEEMVDIAVERQTEESEKPGGKPYNLAISSRRDDSGLRPLLNGELPAVPADAVPVGNVSQNEDWNNVSVDHLDECLDTCLASLRPLPSDLTASVIAVDQCFPKFVILEEASPSQQQPANSSNQSTCCVGVDGTEPVKVAVPANALATISQSTPRLQRVPSKKSVKQELSRKVSSISSDAHLNQTTLSSRDSLQPAQGSSAELNKDPLSETANHQVEEIDQGGGSVQGKSRHAESLKRSEARLQQFAQVFLLQRHIASQQQRAQSAPPFPPAARAGSGSSSHESQLDQTRDICTKSKIRERDSDFVAVHQTHHNANVSQVTSRHTKHNLDRGNVHCHDASSTTTLQPSSRESRGAASLKQHRPTRGADVVVDMVLLLRKIEEVYGTSDVDFEDTNNSCFPTRGGDVEEGGGHVLDTRKRSSALGFTKSISMSQIGLPNVNAMLLVIIAMVVYTKTICQGVLFRTKQTHRKM